MTQRNLSKLLKLSLVSLAFVTCANAASSEVIDETGTVLFNSATGAATALTLTTAQDESTWRDDATNGGAAIAHSGIITLPANFTHTMNLRGGTKAITFDSLVYGSGSKLIIQRPLAAVTLVVSAMTAASGGHFVIDGSFTLSADPNNGALKIEVTKSATLTGPASTITAHIIVRNGATLTLATITGLDGTIEGDGVITGAALTSVASKPRSWTGRVHGASLATVAWPEAMATGTVAVATALTFTNGGRVGSRLDLSANVTCNSSDKTTFGTVACVAASRNISAAAGSTWTNATTAGSGFVLGHVIP